MRQGKLNNGQDDTTSLTQLRLFGREQQFIAVITDGTEGRQKDTPPQSWPNWVRLTDLHPDTQAYLAYNQLLNSADTKCLPYSRRSNHIRLSYTIHSELCGVSDGCNLGVTFNSSLSLDRHAPQLNMFTMFTLCFSPTGCLEHCLTDVPDSVRIICPGLVGKRICCSNSSNTSRYRTPGRSD